MIEITLRDIIDSSDSLKNLSQKPLKARCAYSIGKILKQVDNEMSGFNDTRLELIKKYGEKDENGELITDEKNNVHIIPAHLEDFNAELRELMDTTVELPVNKISIADIGDIEFTPVEMAQLERFIEFDEE